MSGTSSFPAHTSQRAVACLLVVHLFTAGEANATTGPLQRTASTTLSLPPSLYSSQFFTTDALGGLTFAKPVGVTSPPGEANRLFVLEREGRIVVITNLANPTRTVFLDITPKVFSEYEKFGAEGLTGLAFHPNYRTNGQFFVLYKTQVTARGTTRAFEKLARFQVSASDPNRADPATELGLMTQLDEGYSHSWNDAHFGPDGYLYFSAGDEGEAQDAFQNSCRIDKDLYSAILRIDVDKRPGSIAPNLLPGTSSHYTVPPDNPFIGATNFAGQPVDPAKVRTEFYAVGFRNPWRMSFDPVTGWLYSDDVGQHAAEEINIIQKGGNYGWAYFEGTKKGFRGDPPPGFKSVAPMYEYGHHVFGQPAGPDQGKSVTGGIVYRGQRIPELYGFYVFADYISGNIWALRYDGMRVVAFNRLASEQGIAAFGRDRRNGDVLLVNHDTGKIRTFEYSRRTTDLPLKLSDTGVFADVAALKPHAGIVSYNVNVSFCSDNALNFRWFSIPQLEKKIEFHPEEPWTIPEGAVFINHLELELTRGRPDTARRLETRLLVRQPEGIYGLTYRWDDSQKEAFLVGEEGADQTFPINDNGTVRQQTWRFPSRRECQVCHNGGRILGFITPQLNRIVNYPSGPANQIAALRDAGYFANDVTNIHTLRALAPLDDLSASREYRVRSYLDANCAFCHQPGRPARGAWDARIITPTSAASIINGNLNHVEGDAGHKLIKPGSVSQSMILSRITRLGPGRMPPFGSSVVDQEAADLLTAWITDDLRTYRSFSQWQTDYFGSTTNADATTTADPDADGASNLLEYLTGTNPRLAGDPWQITIQNQSTPPQLVIPQPANRAFQVQVAPSLEFPIQWIPFEHPANRLFFPATNKIAIIAPLSTSGPFNFYRVRLLEP